MSRDPLIQAIVAGDGPAVVAALRDLDDAEREARAAGIAALPERLQPDTLRYVLIRGGLRRLATGRDEERLFAQRNTVALALLGTVDFKRLRALGTWPLIGVDPQLAAQVLLERRPRWLASFAAWMLATDEDWLDRWRIVRPLVREGAIERPDGDDYLDALLRAADYGSALELLEADPGLIDRELWELLAGHDGDESFTAADAADAGWADAVLTLELDRDRLLDATLTALASDISAYRATWFTRLWRALKPTSAERAARADPLRALLSAAAEPVVGFAVEQLARVKPLPLGLENELSPALAAHAKKIVRAAIALIDPSNTAAITIALGHEAADIQGEVLDRIERAGLDDATRHALERHLETLAATVRPRAEALLGRQRPREEVAAPDLDLSAIPAAIRDALNFGGDVPPAPIPGEPVLGAPLAPLTREQLDEALLAALPAPWDCNDEFVLDGILRHCDQPLDPRLVATGDDVWWRSVARVALTWHDRSVPKLEPYADRWERRLHEAAQRVARRAAAPMLALPTHAGGWIEPSALVERLARRPLTRSRLGRRRTPDVDPLDLAHAILRLAPAGRAEALAAAHDLPGDAGHALRCALGGPPVNPGSPPADAARAVAGLDEVRVDVVIVDAEYVSDRIELATHGPAKGLVADLVAAAADENRRSFDRVTASDWPARHDLAAAGAIRRMTWNLGDGGAGNTGVPELLEALLDQPLPPLALYLTVLALCSCEEREHLIAADLLIAAIGDGRADASALVPHTREALGAGLLLPNRLGKRLATVAAAGPLQRAVVRETLDRTVDVGPARTLAALLEPFDELCAQTDTGPLASRPFLTTLKGSSKAAKAARSLLARDGDPPAHERALALEARLRRAERWTR